jgi:hypothetical protein
VKNKRNLLTPFGNVTVGSNSVVISLLASHNPTSSFLSQPKVAYIHHMWLSQEGKKVREGKEEGRCNLSLFETNGKDEGKKSVE